MESLLLFNDVEVLSNSSETLEGIPGLSYFPNFIDEAEEQFLLKSLDAEPWSDEIQRRVQQYGYHYNYRGTSIEPIERKIPDWATFICKRLIKQDLTSEVPNQLLLNEYLPGQGIAAHTDSSFFGSVIFSLSLGATYVMDLSPRKAPKEKTSILLEPRSLFVLRGEVRKSWKHGIAKRKRDSFEGHSFDRKRRVSLTLRVIP